MTRRRWIADRWNNTTALLEGEQARHLTQVLRAHVGMEFDIVAGDRVYRAAITGISGDEVAFSLLSEVEADRALPVTLLVSVFKFDRMDWIVEKATELGVESLVPMVAERSEKHLARAAQARVERWRRIAREAAQQSRRSDVPLVGDVIPWEDAARGKPLSRKKSPGPSSPLLLLLSEREKALSLREALPSARVPDEIPEPRPPIALAVGPEGGWTVGEERLFLAEGWRAVSLGPRILRAETAGIAAVAVVAALF